MRPCGSRGGRSGFPERGLLGGPSEWCFEYIGRASVSAIKFLDLKAQYQTIRPEIERAVLGVLESSSYALGPEVAMFEEEFARYHDVRHAVAVNSGTSALHLALLAAGVGPGDEVITVAMTFIATAAAVSYVGAVPVFVDIERDSLTLDASQLEAKITPRTKAIIPVHLHGQSADMSAILEVAERHKLIVIEDAAQAHGAEYKGRRVGGFGDIAAFSFYPGKNLGAYGEGGIVTTNNAAHAEKTKLLRDWGQRRKYHHDMLAYNYRMDAIQGAVLRVKLGHIEHWTERRRTHARHYAERLSERGLRFSVELPERRHVYHIFSIFHPQRERLRQALQDRGVESGFHYPKPVHLQNCYKDLGYREGDLPVTEQVAREQLSLPMYAELSESDVDVVCDVICGWNG